MTNIVERDGRWHVTLEGPNGRPVSKSFATYGRAQAWRSKNAAAKARYAAPETAPDPFTDTLGELLERYGREVSSLKRGAKEEGYRVARLAKAPIASLTVAEVTSKALADFRNERLASVSNSSVRNEMSIIRRTLETARREWGYHLPSNAAALVTLPPPSAARNRRLQPGEYEKLEKVLKGNPVVWAFVRFAVESAMRRSEILSLTWRNVDLMNRLAHLPRTKNGNPRTVPLTDGAYAVLKGIKAEGEKVFNIDISALRWAWVKACEEAGIEDLRIHDLRHEGVSRLFEMELMVPEVAMISGHKTASMLFRYTHLQPLDLAAKLKGRKRRGALDSKSLDATLLP